MDYYDKIKEQLINNEIYEKVKDYSKERNRVITYFEVGKLLTEAGSIYGENIIGKYAEKLVNEVGKKYNIKTLYKFRAFYLKFENFSTMSRNLNWSHYSELLSIDDLCAIKYHIDLVQEQNLTVRELRKRIKNKEYERLDEYAKNKFITKEKTGIKDFIKNPILIKNASNMKIINERILKELILENIEDFMKELGSGYSYIDNEYKIKIGDKYNYIDLLLFNYNYNSFVVIELKVTELKKEHIGQVITYKNYVDQNLKKVNHDDTIGIIISKKDNKYIMSYCSDKRILSREYILF